MYAIKRNSHYFCDYGQAVGGWQMIERCWNIFLTDNYSDAVSRTRQLLLLYGNTSSIKVVMLDEATLCDIIVTKLSRQQSY